MKFCVVGAGAWGTAFALHLARCERSVALVPRRAEQAAAIAAARENSEYLPGRDPSPGAAGLRGTWPRASRGRTSSCLPAPPRRCARRRRTCARPWGRRRAEAGHQPRQGARAGQPHAALPGRRRGTAGRDGGRPVGADQRGRGRPRPAGRDGARGRAATRPVIQDVQAAISGPTLRVYTTDDLAGVEFGGSLKNVYAIAAGCCEGLGLGDNAKAALMTRAVAEMVKVGGSLGARRETFYGLSGFGDLVATCHGAGAATASSASG